ncbi:MAG: phosphoribosyl-AMP cyclohydrolase [Candidatus Altiarchaeales archaeon]|nr:MAG: phosphoribosyl-AMP cyclohydrolase [Candidatus Altiarchaeales archaeon]HDI72801.1 phosphoribosyl-AMP cyclohydrolase [Candidatus Altiarchaeales archaeon]
MEFPWDILKFRNIDGIPDLVLAIAQDADTGEVLMIAFTNREGIKRSLETGNVHYFSTSRKKLWLKGETSGHFQRIREIYVDCDGDAILFKVEQVGAACHKGYRSCFYRKFQDNKINIVGKKISS